MTLQRSFDWSINALNIAYPFETSLEPKDARKIFADAYIVDGTNLRTDFDPIDEQLELLQITLPDANTCTQIQLRYINDLSLFFFAPPVTEMIHFGDWILLRADNFSERKHFHLLMYEPNMTFPYTLNKAVDDQVMTFVARVHEQNLPKIYTVEVTDLSLIHI